MKHKFKNIRFQAKSLALIEQANEMINEYRSYNLTLTLRQLYYQFVARDIIANKQQSYDNLGALISNGRLAGLVDWDAIEDRTRFLRGNDNWSSPSAMINYRAKTYSIDMWSNQDKRVEVWIEKDALVGVIEKVCNNNDMNYFACRGYVSQSELYKAGKRIAHHRENGQDTVVLHLGDHDPSGMDMSRDNHERLELFSEGNVELKRIALNMDQIHKYNPPPNPAKLSDSRAKKYVQKFGSSSWELDALEPRTLESLIQDECDALKDLDMWKERVKLHTRHKKQLNKVVDRLDGNHQGKSRIAMQDIAEVVSEYNDESLIIQLDKITDIVDKWVK